MKKLFGSMILFLAVASGFAQTPPGELHLRPPARVQWTITYPRVNAAPATPTTVPARPEHTLVESDFEITDNIAHRTDIFSDGVRAQIYIVDNMAFVDDLANKEIKALSLTMGINSNTGFKSAYPGFEWIQPSDYIDTVEKNGVRLLHFRQGVSSAAATTPTPSPTPARVNREAWIDANTGLPAFFQVGKRVGVYQFGQTPTEKIKLAPPYEKALRVYNGLEGVPQ